LGVLSGFEQQSRWLAGVSRDSTIYDIGCPEVFTSTSPHHPTTERALCSPVLCLSPASAPTIVLLPMLLSIMKPYIIAVAKATFNPARRNHRVAEKELEVGLSRGRKNCHSTWPARCRASEARQNKCVGARHLATHATCGHQNLPPPPPPPPPQHHTPTNHTDIKPPTFTLPDAKG